MHRACESSKAVEKEFFFFFFFFFFSRKTLSLTHKNAPLLLFFSYFIFFSIWLNFLFPTPSPMKSRPLAPAVRNSSPSNAACTTLCGSFTPNFTVHTLSDTHAHRLAPFASSFLCSDTGFCQFCRPSLSALMGRPSSLRSPKRSKSPRPSFKHLLCSSASSTRSLSPPLPPPLPLPPPPMARLLMPMAIVGVLMALTMMALMTMAVAASRADAAASSVVPSRRRATWRRMMMTMTTTSTMASEHRVRHLRSSSRCRRQSTI
jgi:hypothetical protein